jgi:hypothetical protein
MKGSDPIATSRPLSSSSATHAGGATITASDPRTILLMVSSELDSSAGNTRWADGESGSRRCAARIGSSTRGGMRAREA